MADYAKFLISGMIGYIGASLLFPRSNGKLASNVQSMNATETLGAIIGLHVGTYTGCACYKHCSA